MTTPIVVWTWALVGLATGATLVPTSRNLMHEPPRPRTLYAVAPGATATLFGLLAWRPSDWPHLLSDSAFAALAVPLAIIDILERRLPTPLVYTAYATTASTCATAVLLAGEPEIAYRTAIGASGTLTVYLATALAHPGDLGAGDVRLAGAIGMILAWHSWPSLITGTALAAALGGLLALTMLATHHATRQTHIPAGPPMLLGTLAALLLT